VAADTNPGIPQGAGVHLSIIRQFKIRKQYFKLILFSKLFWFIYYFGFIYLRPVVWEMRRPHPDFVHHD
jgi:hypothetical protein